jgi:hypothetical protein
MTAATKNPSAQPTKPAAAEAASKEPKNMATANDSKLSYTELLKKRDELKKQEEEIAALIVEKRVEEIKVLADGYAKKAAAAGFTPQEAIDALLPYLPAKAQRAVKGSKPRAAKGTGKADHPFVRGTTYVDPKGEGKPWTAGIPGAKPKWLSEAVAGLEGEAAKAKYAQYAKK